MKKAIFYIVFSIISLTIYCNELTVVTEEWKPYNFTERGEIVGTSTEIVKKVLERADIKYQIKVYPWARAYSMAQTNKDVLIYTIIRIPQRELLFKWVRPLGNGGTTSLYKLKKNKKLNILNIEEAKNFSVVANKDSMDEIWLRDNGFKYIVSPPSVESAIRMFYYGRVDMIAFDDAVMEEEITKLGLDSTNCIKLVPLFKTPPYMALSNLTSNEVLVKIQNAYDELLKEGKLELNE